MDHIAIELPTDTIAEARDNLRRLFAAEARIKDIRARRQAGEDVSEDYEADAEQESRRRRPSLQMPATEESILDNGRGLFYEAFEAAGLKVVKPGSEWAHLRHSTFKLFDMELSVGDNDPSQKHLIVTAIAQPPLLAVSARREDQAEEAARAIHLNMNKQPDWPFRLRSGMRILAGTPASSEFIVR